MQMQIICRYKHGVLSKHGSKVQSTAHKHGAQVQHKHICKCKSFAFGHLLSKHGAQAQAREQSTSTAHAQSTTQNKCKCKSFARTHKRYLANRHNPRPRLSNHTRKTAGRGKATTHRHTGTQAHKRNKRTHPHTSATSALTHVPQAPAHKRTPLQPHTTQIHS